MPKKQLPTHTPIKVWDIGVRLFHWFTVALFAYAYFSGEDADTLHENAGYLVAGLAVFRCLWGVVGSDYARFAQFIPGPRMLWGYLRALLSGNEARYLGHNPLGGVMILLLLLLLLTVPFTGWLLTTDWGWGNEFAEQLHIVSTNIALATIAIHVCGVIYMSVKHGENLPKAMITGRKYHS